MGNRSGFNPGGAGGQLPPPKDSSRPLATSLSCLLNVPPPPPNILQLLILPPLKDMSRLNPEDISAKHCVMTS